MSTSKWTTIGLAAGGDGGNRPLGCGGRIRYQGGRLLETHAALGEELPGPGINLAGVAAQQGQPPRIDERRGASPGGTTPREAGELGLAFAKQVRDAHGGSRPSGRPPGAAVWSCRH
jgi:hypothetical protein